MKERRGPAAAAKGLEDEVGLFKRRTPGSARAYERARKWTVYGVHSNYRVLDPYPLYAKRAKGARIWDVDGNAYLDFSMAFGALVAGHSHPTLVKAMRERVANGTIFGFEGEETAKLCAHLCTRFHVDRVKLSNTGMDATMYAMRFARAATARGGILKFEGCYHGSHDALLASVKPTRAKAGDRERDQGRHHERGRAGIDPRHGVAGEEHQQRSEVDGELGPQRRLGGSGLRRRRDLGLRRLLHSRSLLPRSHARSPAHRTA